MRRTLWMVVSLVAIAFWLVLSYVPFVALPVLHWPAWSGPVLAGIAAAGLVVFVAIQVWIVVATDQSLVASAEGAAAGFRLSRGREMLRTALPILMTLVLAAFATGTWRALF